MHILEILCPSLCHNLILGDVDQETQLIQRIIQSQDEERLGKRSYLKIAVLYPSTDSIPIPIWLQSHSLMSPLVSSPDKEDDREADGNHQPVSQQIELIVLDGTYGQATRLVSEER